MIWKKQPVGSKLADLQNNKASKDTATQSAAGLMSASDKTKLDGIATAQSLGGIGTLSAFQSALLTVAQAIPSSRYTTVVMYTSAAFDDFDADRMYCGTLHITANSGNDLKFNIVFSNQFSECVSVGYNNGAWSIEELALNSKVTYSITDMTTSDPIQVIKNNIATIVAMTGLRTLKIYTSQLEYIAVCDTFPGSVLSEAYNSFYITGYDAYCHHLYRYNDNWNDDDIGLLNIKVTQIDSASDNSYGSVTWYKNNRFVFVAINVERPAAQNDWAIIATGLPVPISTAMFAVGLNGASTKDVSLYVDGTGQLKMYGRGTETICNCTITYMSAS